MTMQTSTHHLPTAPSPMMQRHVLARVEDKLARRFADAVPSETVRATVREVAAEFKQGARLTTFLPALTEHEAMRRLQDATHASAVRATEVAVAA